MSGGCDLFLLRRVVKIGEELGVALKYYHSTNVALESRLRQGFGANIGNIGSSINVADKKRGTRGVNG